MKVFKTMIAVAALVASALTVNAQNLKFGHVELQKFISELPEYTEASAQMQAEQQKIEESFKQMQDDMQAKYSDFMSKQESMPELVRQTKEKELQDASERLQQFAQLAQQSLQQKEQQLLSPIVEKVQAALKKVGEANGFIYIFDLSSQVVLFHSEQSVDVSALLKAELSKK